MTTFSVKNFERFQHYKDRSPPWIKLYNELLDDYNFSKLPDASKWHLIAIWLLASRSDNKIPYDAAWIAGRINANTPVDLEIFAHLGFIVVDQSLQTPEQDASNAISECLSRDRVETETEKRTTPQATPADPDPIFGVCLAFLKGKGVDERRGRSFLGLMRKTYGDTTVFEAVEAARSEDVSNPIPWLTNALKARQRDAPMSQTAKGIAVLENLKQGFGNDTSRLAR